MAKLLVEDPRSLKIPIMKVKQPIGTFYIGSIKAKDLFDISDFDIRRIYRERDIETYLGIQRPINLKRLDEIKQYVRTVDATFPTSVIIAVDEDCAKLSALNGDAFKDDDVFGYLTLSNFVDASGEKEQIPYRFIARVIDGQHRIAGLEGYADSDFEMNVTIFIGADISDQANIFSTVNLAQTKVNKSLVYDLFELSKTRSPERTCHEITVALDKTKGSPFFNKIKRLGVATEGRAGETLTQATVVEMMLRYVSANPALDRDLLKRGKKLSKPDANQAQKLIFRNMFIDEQDFKIADIIWNYFEAVQQRWPDAWNSTGAGAVLNRTNGYRGLMRFLRPAYLYYTKSDQVISKEQFLMLFNKVDVESDYFNIDNFKPGTSGETALYNLLVQKTNIGTQLKLF